MTLSGQEEPHAQSTHTTQSYVRKALVITGILLLFLLSLDLMSTSFKLLGKSTAQDILTVAANPFIGLFIGLLMTAIIQSSSTSTSLMVTAVASGSLTLESAIPMVIGANIGTTLTSTIVSLGYITRKKEFRKALAAGSLHDLFNILVTLLIFPLEYYYGFLSTLSTNIVAAFTFGTDSGTAEGFNFRLWDVLPLGNWIALTTIPPLVTLLIAFAGLALTIKHLSQSLSSWLIGESRERMQKYLFVRKRRSFLWGTIITAGVQSSSITSSLIVPFVATGKVSIKKAYPFLMGANIGTTLTAFIAASFQSETALSLAVAHLMFNLIGVLIFSMPYLRDFPVFLANQFGRAAMKFRMAVFLYIIFTFFIVPFSLIKLHESRTTPPLPAVQEQAAPDTLSNPEISAEE